MTMMSHLLINKKPFERIRIVNCSQQFVYATQNSPTPQKSLAIGASRPSNDENVIESESDFERRVVRDRVGASPPSRPSKGTPADKNFSI
jgi:hypothetical protein